MRRIAFAVAAVLMAAGPALGPVLGQVPANVKQRITGNLNNALQQHDQDLENAMNGTDNNQQQQQQPPQPVPPGQIKSGWMMRPTADGKSKVRMYFAYPQNLSKEHPVPALIVLQEWWGLNDDIQERTRDFAHRGFYAVAPDLYNGKTTDDPKQAAQLKQDMTNAGAMTNMETGVDLLTEEAGNGVVDKSRIGAIGWCMGGEQALLLSIADPRIKATAIFYGPLVTDPEKLKNLQGPVLGVFGNNDTHPSPADVQAFKDGLAKAGKTDVTIYQFDGVGHAFASKAAQRVGLYHPKEAKEAWDKTWAWLDAKLLKR